MSAECKTCGAGMRWMEVFPGNICVNCHRENVARGEVNPNVSRVQELRRSNAATPVPSKKQYKRKPKHPKRDK